MEFVFETFPYNWSSPTIISIWPFTMLFLTSFANCLSRVGHNNPTLIFLSDCSTRLESRMYASRKTPSWNGICTFEDVICFVPVNVLMFNSWEALVEESRNLSAQFFVATDEFDPWSMSIFTSSPFTFVLAVCHMVRRDDALPSMFDKLMYIVSVSSDSFCDASSFSIELPHFGRER